MCRLGESFPVAVRSALPTLTAVLLWLLLAPPLVTASPGGADVLGADPAPLVASPRSASTGSAPHLLADLYPLPTPDPSSGVLLLATFADGRALLSASDPLHGREPWISDGTAAGTHRVADLVPGPDDSLEVAPSTVSTGDRVVFLVGSDRLRRARSLWTTDGTAEGTRPLVEGLLASPGTRDHSLLGDGAGRAYLLAMDPREEPGLWVTDGTPAGTRRLPHPGLPRQQAGELLAALPGRVLYVAGTGIGGTQELWGSDGTPGGTNRLLPGPVAGPAYDRLFAGLPPQAFHVAVLDDGTALVLQDLGPDGDPALGLWRTDGTPEGTRWGGVLLDVDLHPDSLVGGERGAFLTFSADDTRVLYRVWMSDGTGSFATRVVHQGEVSAWNLHWLDERLLFTTCEGGSPCEVSTLWIADPSAGPAQPLSTLPGGVVGGPVGFRGGSALVVEGEGNLQELWWTDGTPAGTRRLDSLGRRTSDNRVLGVEEVAGEEFLFLQIGHPDFTWDLFASDGSEGGARPLTRQAFTERFGAHWREPLIRRVGDSLMFSGDDRVHGLELWTTDGTPEGTKLFANLARPRPDGDSWPRGYVRHGDRLLFFARDPEGWGLWETTGTGEATRRLHRVFFTPPPGPEDPQFQGPEPLLLAGDLLFFVVPAQDPVVLDLKVADLAARQVRHLGRFPRTGVEMAVAMDGRLLWAGPGQRAVVSDGTLEGTRYLGLVSLGSTGGLAALEDGSVLLVAGRWIAPNRWEEPGLWRTDGTAAGTFRILAPTGPFLPYELTPMPDGTACFGHGGDDPSDPAGLGLWCSDGTAAGTGIVESFGGLLPTRLAVAEDRLFFVLSGEGRTALWSRSLDSGASTEILTRVKGLPVELPIRWIDWTTPFAGGILFSANDMLLGSRLWYSDGTALGTRPLAVPERGNAVPGPFHEPAEPPVVGDGQAFYAQAGRLWRTDGTAEGTFAVFGEPADPPAGGPRLALPQAGGLAVLDGRLYFVAHTADTGREPWVLGTEAPVALPSLPFPGVPAAPSSLTAESTSDGVWLRWTVPAGDAGLYRVEARTPEDVAYRTVLEDFVHGDGLLRHTAVVEDLPSGVPHDFRVRMINAAGVSPPSEPATGSILGETVTSCQPSATALCLLGGRFRVSVWWRDPRSGDVGQGFAVPFPGTDLSGTFWFFQEENVELIVKALDGTPVNRRWWLFTGGLTDVEYWLQVVDTELEEGLGLPAPVEWYHHVPREHPPRDLCGFADTDAFAGEPGDHFPVPAASAAATSGPPATSLDLLGGRYRVEVEWRDPRSGDTGTGRAVVGSDNTGYFWFFREGNVELVVKVLDGVPVNGHHWVFWGGLTDVDYTIRVTDGTTGAEREYRHATRDLCGGADTTAFRVESP